MKSVSKMLFVFITSVTVGLSLVGFSRSFANTNVPYMEYRAGEHKMMSYDIDFDKMFGGKLMRILSLSKDLNLTQDQQDKIFSILIQMKQRNDTVSTEIMKVRYEVSKELSKSQPDFSKVKSLNSQLARLHSEISLNTKNAFVDVISVLTPEQREKLNSMIFKVRGKGKIDR
ncbi:MAG: periplasmic heavy metal sensor [Brevinematales bacterium]|nr:periplasmic heavy metal sensor [Brevinematales bacterium]